MTQVSKRIIHKSVEKKMHATLWEAIAHLRSSSDIQNFTNDLLSPTERTMVAKRLAIAALLSRNYSYEAIMDLLKVSSATVSKVSLILAANNGYKNTINKIARAETMRSFWQDIENIFFKTHPKFKYLDNEQLHKKLGHSRKTLL